MQKSNRKVATRSQPTSSSKRLAPNERRKQILSAAIAYFSEVGFDGGTRALATQVGVTQPLLYYYFPSKEDLIREVYNNVYLSRWKSEWSSLLSDRSIPLRERLITFYVSYCGVIFSPEWLRIYLFSGLRRLIINKWWTSFVEEHVLKRICEEIRHELGIETTADTPITDEEMETFWMFHGGIFYFGMRRDVYETEPRISLERFIERGVEAMLRGYPAVAKDQLTPA